MHWFDHYVVCNRLRDLIAIVAWSNTLWFFADGKYHVLPSGDLHILRTDEGDAGIPFSCLVENSLTGIEESSPPYHLTLDSKMIFYYLHCRTFSNIFFDYRHRNDHKTKRAHASRLILLLRSRQYWCLSV